MLNCFVTIFNIEFLFLTLEGIFSALILKSCKSINYSVTLELSAAILVLFLFYVNLTETSIKLFYITFE